MLSTRWGWADQSSRGISAPHAGSQHIGDRMRDVRRITSVSNVSSKCIGDFAAAIGQREQHHAAVRGQPASRAIRRVSGGVGRASINFQSG